MFESSTASHHLTVLLAVVAGAGCLSFPGWSDDESEPAEGEGEGPAEGEGEGPAEGKGEGPAEGEGEGPAEGEGEGPAEGEGEGPAEGEGEGEPVACAPGSGPCCDDAAGVVRGADTVCEADTVSEYTCNGGEGCGHDILVRSRSILCSGKSPACDGGLSAWSDAVPAVECGDIDLCVEGQDACQVGAEQCDPTRRDYCLHHGDFTPCDDLDPARSYDICQDGACVSPGCGDLTCNTGGPHFPLPGPGRFFTVSDPAETGEEVIEDSHTGLVWTREPVRSHSLEAAVRECVGLNHAGLDDWRLPDRYELQSIVDYSRHDPAVDGTAFLPPYDRAYWSASLREANDAYSVALQDGRLGASGADGGGRDLAPLLARTARVDGRGGDAVVYGRRAWRGRRGDRPPPGTLLAGHGRRAGQVLGGCRPVLRDTHVRRPRRLEAPDAPRAWLHG